MKIQYPLLILLLAIQYSLAGQPMEIRRLLHLQKEIKEDTSHVLWYNDVSKAYRMVDPDSSIYYAGEGINLANRSGFQKGLGLCYSSIAIGYSIKGMFTEGTAYCQKAIDINKRVNRAQLPTNYTNMGIILQSQARLTEGLKYQNMALEVAKEVGDKVYIAKAYNNIGDALLAQGNYQQAVGYFYKFLKVADELNDSLGISIAYGNISNVLRLQQDFNLALEYQQKTMAFHKRMNNKVSLLSDYYNTGNIYFALNRIDEAIHHYTDAIRLAREIGNEKELGLIYVYTGAAYLRKKNYAAAENFLLKADTLNKKTNNINGLTVGSISLSRLFEQLNKPGLQKQFAFKALELARRENLKPEMRDASEILYRYYKQQGNSKEALLYHELFTGYKDSLFNVETIRQVKAAEYKYAADDQQEKILLLQKQNELKQKENNIQRLYMVGFVLLFAASVSFMLYYLRQAKLKNRLNSFLEEKNKEIEIQNKQIKEQSTKLEELNLVKNKVISVMSHDVKSPMASLEMLLGMAEEQNEPEVFRSMMGEIKTSVAGLMLLLENILGWAKSQMQFSADVPMTNVDVHQAGQEIVKLYEQSAEQKHVTLKNFIPANTIVNANKDYLSLVLRNLVSNAIKFSGSGTTVQLNCIDNHDSTSISVEDSGVGMSNEEIARLFNVNSLYTSKGTKNEKGTGLGLIFVKESLERCGGTLSIKSEKHKGSEFICEFRKYHNAQA